MGVQLLFHDYDDLNRLLSADEGDWRQDYGHDGYGNHWVTPGSYMPTLALTPQSQSAFDETNNRLVASEYDDAGNQTKDAMLRHFSHDAENRQTSYNSGAANYSYDGEGRRVKKADATGVTVFVYDAMGRLLCEYSDEAIGEGETRYLTQDHLGSTRVVTNSSGDVISRHDYLPYGEEIGTEKGGRSTVQDNGVYTYAAPDGTTQRFSGKERDNESGLDYFLARYYSGPQGRFTSPDPDSAGAFRLEPQSWNAYSYVRNDPVNLIDPDGRDPYLPGDHNLIIDRAFPGLSNPERGAIQRGSNYADTTMPVVVGGRTVSTQSPEAAFVHGMSDGLHGQDRADARQLTDQFILDYEGYAWHLQDAWLSAGNSGLSPDALFYFGIASHPVTDRTSPAHSGEQPWGNSNFLLNLAQQIEHLARENVAIGGGIDMAVDAIRGAFLDTFGDYWYQKAITKHGSYDDPTVKEIIANYSMPGVFAPGQSLEAQLGLALYLYQNNLN